MEHSIALVTGATSGLGYAAARALAGEGWREIIVTGRSLARVQETAAQLAAETKTTGLHAAGAGSGRADQCSIRARRAGQARSADRFPAAQCRDGPRQETLAHCGGRRGFSGPADRPSSTDCRVASSQPAEPQRADRYRRGGTCPRGRAPCSSYTDVPAFAAKYHHGDRTAAVEALLRNGPNVKYVPNSWTCIDAGLTVASVGRGAGVLANLRHGRCTPLLRPATAYRHHKAWGNARPASKYSFIRTRTDSRHESRRRRPRPCSVPPGVGVRNHRLRAILRLGSREVHRPN